MNIMEKLAVWRCFFLGMVETKTKLKGEGIISIKAQLKMNILLHALWCKKQLATTNLKVEVKPSLKFPEGASFSRR